ncbi:VapE domain-containing protein [Roseateles sp. 22389]|uniref:VapE domain-containing protein n=1 Tax=Roseateles sp. 22389 TaxID=3453916 RepID=UPI00261FDBF2|nr:VapE domain-containing protein [uncultured Roseateles sp.]
MLPTHPPSTASISSGQLGRGQLAPTTTARATLGKSELVDPFKFPDRNPLGGKPPTTIPNLEYVLEQYGVTIRYDVISKCMVYEIPGCALNPDNVENIALAEITSLAAANGLNTQNVALFLDAIAGRNSYNPVLDWIESKPWDGHDRLPEFYRTVTVIDEFPLHLRDALIYRWLLSATAAAVLATGFHARGVLTLQGAQSIGKTSWIRRLIPDPLRSSVLKIDHHLDPNNKDSIIAAVSHWIVEIGELDSSFRKDIARLKGFLTGERDKVRRPYARSDSNYERRTVFCATVNETSFLVDNTGNSRWWTLPVKALDCNHDVDMQQLFAQLKLLVDSNEQWWLTSEEELELNTQNLQHLSVSVLRESIRHHLDEVKSAPLVTQTTKKLTATKVLLELGFESPTNKQAKECAEILRQLVGSEKRVHGSNVWEFPIIAVGKIASRVPATPAPPAATPGAPPQF